MDSNSEIQGYNVYPMLHFHRKFSSGVTARPAKSAPWSLLVNRFAVLDIEEVNTDICEPIDAPLLPPSAPDRTTQPWKPKWEKRLPKRLSVNTLDARGMSIILPIEVSTTDTSEVHSIKALLGNFID